MISPMSGIILELLPEDLTLESAKTLYFDEGVVFQSKHSVFSNMYPCYIKYGLYTYGSVEQGFVQQAALECNAPSTAAKALRTTDPYEAKKLLKKLPHYAEWVDKGRFILMKKLHLLKFRQNPHLLPKLLATKQLPLYESTRDLTWATGYIIKDGVKNCTPKGQNRCGESLMAIRAIFQRVEDKKPRD